MAAHRDTRFRFLQNVRIGDIIEAEGTDGIIRRYRVKESEVVRWYRFAIQRDAPANELALSTCYPFDAILHGPLRYVVHAERVS